MSGNELNNNPFKVPKDYFDTLPGRIQNKYLAKNKRTHFAVRPQWVVAGVLGMAALIVSVFNLSDMDPTHTGITKAAVDFITKDSATPYNTIRVSDQDKPGILNEGMINYLALENISIDDILNARF